MRVTAGRLKGRALAVPSGREVRPTSDKVRQAIFNILRHGDFGGFVLQGARVIDLFAGSGALGIEALSRGARYALFIEDSAEARAAIRANVEAMGLTGVTKIWRRDAAGLGRNTGGPFDLAFLDPPYRRNLVAPGLLSLRAGGWLRPSALAVAETAADEDVPLTEGYEILDQRTYGETRVLFLRAI